MEKHTKNDQERLNEAIAYELDKYQVILEYGRVQLGASDDTKKKYQWLCIPQKTVIYGIIVDIGSAIVSAVSSMTLLVFIFIILLFLLIAYILIRYFCRDDISNIMDIDAYNKLKDLLKDVNSYISNLGRWLAIVDVNIVAKKSEVQHIQSEFNIEKAKVENIANEISDLFGKLKPNWDKRARNFAKERLEQYKRFTNVQGSKSSQ